jgi:hypothetical protein
MVLAAALAVSLPGYARAQVMVDVSKITCEQFAFSKVGPPRSIAMWLSGYYAGRRGNPVLDVQGFEANVEKIERICKEEKNAKLPLMQVIEQTFGQAH